MNPCRTMMLVRHDLKVNQRGFSLLEAVVAMGLMGVVASGTYGSFAYYSNLQNQMANSNKNIVVSSNLRGVLENPEAWKNTVNNPENTILQCINDATQDCTGKQDVLRRVSGPMPLETYFDPASHGFNLNGEVCKLSESVAQCPITARIGVEFICQSKLPNCKNPTVLLDAKFSSRDSQLSINLTSANFIVKKSTTPLTCTLGCDEKSFLWKDGKAGAASGFERPPLKVIMVVDNSALMSGFFTNPSDKLNFEKKLREWIHGDPTATPPIVGLLDIARQERFDIDFHIFSTTQLETGGSAPVAEVKKRCQWLDGTKTWKYLATGCESLPSYPGLLYSVERETYFLTRSNPLAATPGMALRLDHETTDLTQAQYVADQIWAHFEKAFDGTGGGDSNQKGLCTLNRALAQVGRSRAAALEFNTDNWSLISSSGFAPLEVGDRALFLFFSNESDKTGDPNLECYFQKNTVKSYDAYGNLSESTNMVRLADATTGSLVKGFTDSAWGKLGPASLGYSFGAFARSTGDAITLQDLTPPIEHGLAYRHSNFRMHVLGNSSPEPFGASFEVFLDGSHVQRMLKTSMRYSALAPNWRIIGVKKNGVDLRINRWTTDSPSLPPEVFVRGTTIQFNGTIPGDNDTITLRLERINNPPRSVGSNFAYQDVGGWFSRGSYNTVMNYFLRKYRQQQPAAP